MVGMDKIANAIFSSFRRDGRKLTADSDSAALFHSKSVYSLVWYKKCCWPVLALKDRWLKLALLKNSYQNELRFKWAPSKFSDKMF